VNVGCAASPVTTVELATQARSRHGVRVLGLACRPSDLDEPSDLAERLPNSLIHRNVPGERVPRRADP
jgi:hypothetical protein